MATRMLIDATHPEETRVVVLRGNRLEEFDFESATKKQLKGNIYLAKVTRVEPSLQAAFVEYGGNRHGFLAFSEIHPDYYQIPVADRQALLDEEEEAAAREQAEEDAEDLAADARGADDESMSNVTEVATDSDDDDAVTEVLPGDDDEPPPDGPSLAAEAEFESPILEGDPTTLDVVSDSAAPAKTDPADGDEPAAGSTSPAEADSADAQADNGEAEAPAIAEDTAPAADDLATEDANIAVEQPDDDVESEVEVTTRPARRPRRSYKIQEVIKRRQIMLVQVVKEERGNKGAALTTYLSLAGRYCVLMPNSPRGGGISRKIQNPADRKRLKAITGELEMPKGMSVIVRTAGLNRTKPEIKRDYEYLLRMWDSVRNLTLESTAPALVYEEGNLIKRAIRDLYSKDVEEILVEGEDGYREAKDFMRMLIPSHARNVQLYKERVPLFQRFQVETLLDQMFNPTVQLRSGGYIVINPTEALVSIDVNSGRATREHNIEETAAKTNLEAAEEIARQLRLRDLAGLIVIDFIDMEDQRNARAVERKLNDCLRNDRARIQIGRISPFGLLEMSRQRLRPGLLEASTLVCPHCRGAGVVRSTESSALHVLRAIEEEGMRERSARIAVAMPAVIALYILNQKRETLLNIEQRYDFKVAIEVDDALIAPDYRLERLAGRTTPLPPAPTAVRSGTMPMLPDSTEDDAAPEETVEDGAEEAQEKPRNGRRRRRRRSTDRTDGPAASAAAEEVVTPAADPVAADDNTESAGDDTDGETEQRADGDDGGERRGRRRRGRRGGRRRRSDETENSTADSGNAAADTGAPAPEADTADGPWPEWSGDSAEAEAADAQPAPAADDAAAFPEALNPDVPGADTTPSPEALALATDLPEPAVDEPAVQAPAADTSADTAVPGTMPPEAAPVSVPDTETAPDQPRAPSRRGWWQRRFGA